MNTQVTKMLGRFQKTGMKLFTESTKALSKPLVQYAIGSILILYITFLESESESILSVAMTNPLGRLLVLLVLLLLVSISVPIGILFAILVVMSCTNRENFESAPPHTPTLPSTPPSGFQDNDDAMQRAIESAKNGLEGGMGAENEEQSFEESFLDSHGMSPELKEDEMEGFQGLEPANGKLEGDDTGDGEIKGFTAQTSHSLF